MWFDVFDVQEYFNKDIITNSDVKQYKEDLSYSYLSHNIKDINDKEHIKEFLQDCNKTIDAYNR